MVGLFLLADYFEDTEAIATLDVLQRAGHKIIKASLMNRLEVATQCGSFYQCDMFFDDVDINSVDYLLIPGGKASFTILNVDLRVEKVIDEFVSNNKLVAAICAAPHLLARKGYFKNREFTCFPGFEKYAKEGTYRKDLGVVRDDKFVTAKSMYYSIEFALNIVSFLEGEAKANLVKNRCMGE